MNTSPYYRRLALAVLALAAACARAQYSATLLHPDGFTGSSGWGVSGNVQVGQGQGPSTINNTHAMLWNGSAASAVDLNPTGFDLSYATAAFGNMQGGYGYGSRTGG